MNPTLVIIALIFSAVALLSVVAFLLNQLLPAGVKRLGHVRY